MEAGAGLDCWEFPIHIPIRSKIRPIGGMDFEPVQNWSRFLQPAYKIKLVI